MAPKDSKAWPFPPIIGTTGGSVFASNNNTSSGNVVTATPNNAVISTVDWITARPGAPTLSIYNPNYKKYKEDPESCSKCRKCFTPEEPPAFSYGYLAVARTLCWECYCKTLDSLFGLGDLTTVERALFETTAPEYKPKLKKTKKKAS